jgi:hypothetical protein
MQTKKTPEAAGDGFEGNEKTISIKSLASLPTSVAPSTLALQILQLRLQHHAGDLVDTWPTCPLPISREVDYLTMRLDRVNRLLRPLLAPGGGGRHG